MCIYSSPYFTLRNKSIFPLKYKTDNFNARLRKQHIPQQINILTALYFSEIYCLCKLQAPSVCLKSDYSID